MLFSPFNGDPGLEWASARWGMLLMLFYMYFTAVGILLLSKENLDKRHGSTAGVLLFCSLAIVNVCSMHRHTQQWYYVAFASMLATSAAVIAFQFSEARESRNGTPSESERTGNGIEHAISASIKKACEFAKEAEGKWYKVEFMCPICWETEPHKVT